MLRPIDLRDIEARVDLGPVLEDGFPKRSQGAKQALSFGFSECEPAW